MPPKRPKKPRPKNPDVLMEKALESLEAITNRTNRETDECRVTGSFVETKLRSLKGERRIQLMSKTIELYSSF